MLGNIKLLMYFRHVVLMSTVNKVRLVLTAIGIFIAVFLFSVGLIITDSYYTGNIKVISDMQEHTLVITSNKSPEDVKNDLSEISSLVPIEFSVLSERQSILSSPIGNDQYINVMAIVQGVSNNTSLGSVISEDGLFLPSESKLVKGRLISDYDNQSKANVVVIDEFTEMLLFPNSDGIGEYIEIGVGVNGTSIAVDNQSDDQAIEIEEIKKLQIIGVVKDSSLTETRELALKRQLERSRSDIYVETSIFCPISTMSDMFKDIPDKRYYVYFVAESNTYLQLVSSVKSLIDISLRKNEYFSLVTKETLLDQVENEMYYTRSMINIITLVLCIISGISIMSTTFFSVKERIPEIGIRKAFGASRIDILFQFVFEMIIIAFWVSIFAVCISFLVCKFAENYLTSKLYMSFSISVSTKQLILPVLVGIIEAIVCSIFPSLYASQIKVTESLKFE